MLTPSGRRWFAVYTLPHREALAALNLEQQGFEAFLPRVVVSRRHARKTEIVTSALFPRYAFVRLDPDKDRWRSVNGTRGVVGLVMARDALCPIPEGIIEALMERCEADGTLRLLCELKPGDPVRVVEGALAGQIGTLLRLDEKGRVEMLMGLLRGTVRVRAAQKMLEPAS